MILVAFLFQWRTALISIVAIPLSLLTAALVLYFTSSAINTMVLAGLVIAVGVVVDDAIIDVENSTRRRKHMEDNVRAGFGSDAPRAVTNLRHRWF